MFHRMSFYPCNLFCLRLGPHLSRYNPFLIHSPLVEERYRMHFPEHRIELATGLAGRGRRFVTRTRAERKMRLDITSDRCLVTACKLLADPENLRDSASVSMVCRRALRMYSDYLD